MSKVNRNDPCPCGSGKKYKQCCMNKDQAPRRQRAALAGQLAADGSGENVAEALAAYEEVFNEIEKITESLDTHRIEFQKMMNSPKALAEHAQKLFTEERFEPYRFSPEAVQQACQAAAYEAPPAKGTTEYGQFLILTTGYLANKQKRLEIARDLLQMIPDYVDADRPMDAWLLQFCAYHMAETANEANPFLTEMLNYGLEPQVETN